MSARSVDRALQRLATSACVLVRERGGASFALYPRGDRRCRPILRLSNSEVRGLEAEGALTPAGDDGFAITDAGRARARRREAAPGEAFAAQHRPIIDRTVMIGVGEHRTVRGHDLDATLRRLTALRDGNGAPWLDVAELAAAAQLRRDWEAGEQGLVRGSDWAAAPRGATSRAGGREGALAAHCDARRRVADALAALAPSLRRVVERVCLRDEGLETLERAEAWPARSGKIALKLALAQLAAARSG